MLSYRHAFHAGNHADVFKHIVLTLTVAALARKEKPFVYIDTHAGAGLYDLRSEQARRNCEFESGISRIRARRPLINLSRLSRPSGRQAMTD